MTIKQFLIKLLVVAVGNLLTAIFVGGVAYNATNSFLIAIVAAIISSLLYGQFISKPVMKQSLKDGLTLEVSAKKKMEIHLSEEDLKDISEGLKELEDIKKNESDNKK